MKSLVFVDDDPVATEVVRGILAGMTDEWNAQFVSTAEEALQELTRSPCDLILSDIHLVGTGGIQLLTEVKSNFPQTVRIACSGCAHPNTIVQSLEVAHQYLPKPLTQAMLKTTLGRTHELRDRVSNVSLQQLVADIRTLPSIPTVYQELVASMQSPQATMETAERIISKDMAMLSKVLQVVNSAYFGLRRTISSPGHALALLGLDRVKALVLTIKVFEQCEQSGQLPIPLEQLWSHGLTTAVNSRAIAKSAGAGSLAVENAFMAGLLHDIGLLVLNTNFPDRYREVFQLIQRESQPVLEAERHVFGATHADVGSYLLGIWGLHESIVEAVAFHHAPPVSHQEHAHVLSAVHVANTVDEELHLNLTGGVATPIATDYLTACHLGDKVTSWRDLCAAPQAASTQTK